MASLGKFGVAHEVVEDPNPATFDWFDRCEANGNPIRLTPLAINQIELIDLMETIQRVDEDDPRSMTIVKDLFRQVLHVDDFDAFWGEARANRQEIADLMPVYQVLMTELTSRPTPQPSDSSPGRLGTQESSVVVSSSAVEVSPGRPDLVLLLQGGADTRAKLAAAAG